MHVKSWYNLLAFNDIISKMFKNATFGQIFVFIETLHCKVYMSKIQTEKKNSCMSVF